MKTLLRLFAILAISSPLAHTETEWNKVTDLSLSEPGETFYKGIKNLCGIGAVINKKEGKCVITRFFEGSGAEAAGLKIDDIITHVDEKDVSRFDLPDIAALLRGDPDTKMSLTIVRGNDIPRQFPVVRHPVRITN